MKPKIRVKPFYQNKIKSNLKPNVLIERLVFKNITSLKHCIPVELFDLAHCVDSPQ